MTLSLSRKVNLGNYESADCFVSLSGITENTTQDEIDSLLSGAGALAFSSVRAKLSQQIKESRLA